MLRIRILLCALLCCSALAATATEASASHGQMLFFEASTDLLNPQTREHVVSQLQSLGVRALRVELSWYSVAPDPTSVTKPNFEATNPSSYGWEPYDWILNRARELHWHVLLTVSSPVPRWATSNHQAPYITRPDPQDFKEFMTAVGRHYNSQVSLYAIWNEPNQPAFLLPQFNSNRTAASPRIYRALFQEGYAGLQAAGITHPKVLMGETAPTGYDTVPAHEGLLHNVAPLAFLRGALCLNSHYKRSSSCSSLPAYGYSHHAYTKAAGPFYDPPGADNVTIGVLGRLTHALDLAAKAHAIKAHIPVYLTEFGIQSYPNRELGVPVSKQAQFDAIAEKIAYENPRMAAFSQYLMSDDNLGGPSSSSADGGFVGFQTGLEYVNYTPKPLYYAFPVPLVIHKTHSGYALWGLVRLAGKSTKVTVLVKKKGARSFTTLKTLTTNSAGYWTLSSKVKGLSWSVRWKSPGGTTYNGPPIAAY
ncbi:MAG TPA: hypothetical protein VID48_11965 [Solirubrobacteraceae bacterium]|jgi:hypothetical protein